MREKLRGAPAMVIAVIALFVAIGGGYAIGKGFIGTGDLKKQAVTNKKIKKRTIKANRVANDTLTGQQINEASLSAVGTARAVRQDTGGPGPGRLGYDHRPDAAGASRQLRGQLEGGAGQGRYPRSSPVLPGRRR